MLDFSGKGRYQHLLTAALVLGFLATSFVYTLFGFATPAPAAFCQRSSASGPVLERCAENEACAMRAAGKNATFEFEYENWTKSYSLYCDRTSIRSAGESTMLTVSAILCMVLLHLADFKGRLALVYGCGLLYVTGSVGTLLADQYIWKSVLMGLANTPENIYGPLLAFVEAEYSPQETQFSHLLTMVGWLALPTGKVVSSLLTLVSMDATFLNWCMIVACCLGGIFPILVFRESPVFLLHSRSLETLLSTLEETRRINRLGEEPLLKEETRQMILSFKKSPSRSSGTDTFPLKMIFSDFRLLVNIVAMCMGGAFFNTVYLALALNVGEIGSDDIRINGLVNSTVQLIGAVAAIPVVQKFKPRLCILWSQALLILCGLMLFIIGHTLDLQRPRTKNLNLLISGVVVPFTLSTGLPAFYIYVTDLFPAKVNGTAYSMISIVLGVLTIGSPWLAQLSMDHGYHFMVGCTLPGLIALPLSFLLKEN